MPQLPPAVRYASLASRTVLVSGGGSGIGESLVRAFAAQSCRVAFVDLAEEPSRALQAEMTAAGAEVRFFPCDVTDIPALQAAIAAAAEVFGPVTVLVNNAAHDQRHTVEEITPERWDERLAVNLKHQFFAAQAVVPMMRAAGGGSIVNLGSISWRIGSGSLSTYVTAKAGVEGLTRGLARDLGPDGIRVNCIAPGWIMTRRQKELWVTPEAIAKLMQDQCLKRELQPEEVAKVALFLASDEASAMTGQTVVVDGGWTR
jgi:NAD(P)-dependent dehydrogenase (short-subunit alcohol dehydrogenase family)